MADEGVCWQRAWMTLEEQRNSWPDLAGKRIVRLTKTHVYGKVFDEQRVGN
jgi:hypothetical protein